MWNASDEDERTPTDIPQADHYFKRRNRPAPVRSPCAICVHDSGCRANRVETFSIVNNKRRYLDSRGVALRAFDGTDIKSAERFKLFSDDNLRAVVFERLRKQLAECGACATDATVKPCLACGRIATTTDREGLHKHFAGKGWELWDEKWLRESSS